MKFITGSFKELQPQLMTQVAKYRHKVFVEKLGWQLQCKDALEYDQFDREDTMYVVVQDDRGNIVGTARLLPTSGPYLLGEVFPQLLHGLPAPCSDDVWELSRVAALDFNAKYTAPSKSTSSPIMVGLVKAALACAAAQGAKELVSVSPVGVERLLYRAGFVVHRMGAPVIVDGKPIMACMIPVAQS